MSGAAGDIRAEEDVLPKTKTVYGDPRSEAQDDRMRLLWAVLPAALLGVLVGIGTVVFICLVVYGYYVLTPEVRESAERARVLAGGVLPAAFFAFAVTGAACLIGYLARWRSVVVGFACGLAAAATEQGIVMRFPPNFITEIAGYFLVGCGLGLLGGWLGGRAAERSAANGKAFYDAMLRIGAASEPDVIARAVASVAGRRAPVGVALWREVPGDIARGPEASWRPATSRLFTPNALLEAAGLSTPGTAAPRAVRARSLPKGKRSVWERQGVGSAFIAPLLSSDEAGTGLLVVGFAEASRASRLAAARPARRRLLSAAAAAALALEKQERGIKLGELRERARLSRELHDSVCGHLHTVRGELGNADWAAHLGAEKAVETHLERAREAACQGEEEARRLARELRPRPLEGRSLAEAAEALTGSLLEEAGIEAACEISGSVRRLPPDTEHALYRIAEEALRNVRKHSQASRVRTILRFEEERVMLTICDDGAGLTRLPSGGAPGEYGFGMRNMAERAREVGGVLRLSGEQGTTVTAEVPIVPRQD